MRRYSPLTQIPILPAPSYTLSLSWAARFTASGGAQRTDQIHSTLLVNGIVYFTSPNNVWAAGCPNRTATRFVALSIPGKHGRSTFIGQSAAWVFTEALVYFESPDRHTSGQPRRPKTGKVRWKVSIADPKLDYTSTVAPVVIGNHVIAGIGGDHLDNPDSSSRRDPGNRRPAMEMVDHAAKEKGEPGMEAWPDEYSSAHGTRPGDGFPAPTILN